MLQQITEQAQILVANKAGGMGDVVVVKSGAHIWTHNETLASWRLKFPERPVAEYHRNFSLITVTDKTPEFILPLVTSDAIREDGQAPVYFEEPVRDSSEWVELYTTGGIVREWSVVEQYLKVRV